MHASDGTELVLHDLGGSGDDVLVTHGAGLCATMLAPMANALAGNYHTVGLDLRGHGASSRPVSRDYTWARIGKDVREILATAPRLMRIFGHSLGGSAALLAALERPDAIRSLCLFEPIILGAEDEAEIEEIAQQIERRRAVFESRAEIAEHFSRRGVFATLDQRALADYVVGGFHRQADGTFALALPPEDEAAVFRESTAPGVWDGLDILPELDLEITVLYGSTSTGSRAAGAQRLAKLDSRVRVVEVEGVGHFGPFEAPELVGKMVSTIFQGPPEDLPPES
jgi:pimeloyl-ACP methyl ester carboxylesterase